MRAATGTATGTAAIRRLVLFAALGSWLQACGGDNLLLPSAGQPSKIAIIDGDHQSGTVGQMLEHPVVVEVTDPESRPVENVEVAFVAPAGAELSPNDTVFTGPDGRATVRYKLGTAAGDQVVEARAKPVLPTSQLRTTFTASAAPEGAVALTVAGGNGQVGQVSIALPESLAVRAVDRFGNGVAGVEVTWEATGGSLSPATVVTGVDGRAAVERVMGDRPGAYPTTAAASDLTNSPLSFASNAVAAPSPALVLLVSPSSAAQAGVPFPQQPELQLEDPFGAPLHQADVLVTAAIATGPGSLSGETTGRSDAEGMVRFTDLEIRGEPGRRILIFAAEGFSSATSSSVVVAPGPPSPEESSASVPNGTAGQPTVITVSLTDEFANPIEGAATSLAISVQGANQVSGLPVTDLGGGSYRTSYTPLHSGTDQVEVLANGAAISASPFSSTVIPGPAAAATTTVAVSREGFFIYTINVVVTTRDAQGNLLARGGDHVEIQPLGGDRRDAVDRGDGTYATTFSTFSPDHGSDVFLNGEALPGNPYRP
ncbi:MAG: Ig-like domain-containing protein [Gemmatimonadales bacterium]